MVDELPIFEVAKTRQDIINLINQGTYQFKTAGWRFEPQSQKTGAHSVKIPERMLDFAQTNIGYKIRGPTTVSVVTEVENLSGEWDKKIFFDVGVRNKKGLKWSETLLGTRV